MKKYNKMLVTVTLLASFIFIIVFSTNNNKIHIINNTDTIINNLSIKDENGNLINEINSIERKSKKIIPLTDKEKNFFVYEYNDESQKMQCVVVSEIYSKDSKNKVVKSVKVIINYVDDNGKLSFEIK